MKRRLLVLALLLLLLPSGCKEETERPEGSMAVYYAVVGEASVKKAVDCEYHTIPDGSDRLIALAELVMEAPEREDMISPVASVPGVTLRSAVLGEGGRVHLDFSEHYGGLSDIGLSIANACFTLTLCSLEDVESVYITVEGKPITYQSLLVLGEEDILLTGGEE